MGQLRQIFPVDRALLICAVISSCMLGGAFLFEYFGGLAPCKMCIWQRWMHIALTLSALLGLLCPIETKVKPALLFVFLIALASAVIAGFHAGVEWHFWDGPAGCVSAIDSSTEIAFQVDQLLNTPVVRCDDVPWSLFGISMAGWNAIFSLDIAVFALMSWIVNRDDG